MRPKLSLLFVGLFLPVMIAFTISTSTAITSGAVSSGGDITQISASDRLSASPDIAAGADGGINVIWVDKGEAKPAADEHAAHRGPQPGGHSHQAYNNLYFARSTDGGRTFSTPLRVNAKDGELWGFATSHPRIAIGKSGIIHIFYQANRRDASATRQAVDVRHTRSIDGGKTFAPPRTLNSEAKGMNDGEMNEAHCFGTMGVAPNGDVHTFWIDTRHMTSEKDNGAIYTAVSRDEGKTFERERMLFRNSACPCCQMNVAFTPKGEVILSARNVSADGARDSSVAVSKDGGRTYSGFVATTPNKWVIAGCPLKPTALATDRQGQREWIYAAWFSGGENPQGSYFAVSEDGGKTFSKPIALHPEASTPDRPRIAVAGGGGVTVAWDAKVGEARRVYLRTSKDHGKTFGSIVELDAPAGTAGYPAIAAARNGKTLIAWQQNSRVMLKTMTP